MSKSKVDRLRKHAKERGYRIDEQLTAQFKDALSDERINLRIPAQLKKELISAAEKRSIPYQRYIKSILVEAVVRERVKA